MVNLFTEFWDRASTLSPEGLDCDPKHRLGARYSTVFVLCCKRHFARECVGLWDTSIKHRPKLRCICHCWERKQLCYLFGFQDVDSKCLSHLIEEKNITPNMVKVHFLHGNLGIWTLFFLLLKKYTHTHTYMIYPLKMPYAWTSWVVSYKMAELINKRNRQKWN